MKLDAFLNRPRMMRAVTSLEADEFEQLAGKLEALLERMTKKRTVEGQPRERARGGGAKGALPTAQHKLLFILVYFKVYATQDVMGAIFGLSQPQVCHWVERLTPLLHRVLGKEQVLPERRARSLEAALKRCPGLGFLVDGTERPIRRPGSEPQQRQHYSGKRKTHTLKNVLVTSGREVVYLGPSRPGSEHDKKVAQEDWKQSRAPEGTLVLRDGGFRGLQVPGMASLQPFKRTRGRELDDWLKEWNRQFSRLRVVVEHVLAGVKRCRIVSDEFRNRRPGLSDLVMELACGLHNFRTQHRTTA